MAGSRSHSLARVDTAKSNGMRVAEQPVNRAGQASSSPENTDPDLEKAEHIDTVLHQTVTAQDWTGPHDPENPLNWSVWKKNYHVVSASLMALTATIGSSIYTPGIPDIMEQFGASEEVVLLGLALWVVGLAFGPVLAAPLSETRGRMAVYRLSLPVSGLLTLGSGLAKTPASLIVTRFFGGVFASPVLAVGPGSISDMYAPRDRAIPTTIFISWAFAGPVLGPVIGGFVAEAKGWQWTQWVLLMFVAASLLFSVAMKETHKKTLLKKRAKHLGIAPPNLPGPTGAAALKMMLVITVFRPVHMLLTESTVGLNSLYIAFNFSVLFAFFDAFPIVFEGVYGFDRGHAGLIWLFILLGIFLAVATILIVDHLLYQPRYRAAVREGSKGNVAPEHRLYVAMMGSLGLPVGLFWLAWTARSDISWASPAFAAVPFSWGNLCVFASNAMYLVDTYGPLTGASAMAANGLLRYGLGGVFPLFTNQMYAKLGIGWATTLFGFISIALLPIPWAFFRFGSMIRARSKYDTVKT